MSTDKIIWSVNVMDNPELQAGALFLLGALTRAGDVAVVPAFVLNPPHLPLVAEAKDFEEAFIALAEKRFVEISAKSDISRLSLGKVIPNRSDSIKAQVKALVEFAESEKAAAIVVSTHARTGVPRFFLGSFAETLVFNSPVPVITVNPQAKVRERISKILFPTTFQARYRPAFAKVLEMAKSLDAGLTLFYKEPLIPSPFMSPEIYDYIEREALMRAEEAKEWQKAAASAGVVAEIHLDNRAGYVPPAIAKYASNEDFDLIAMASQSGGWPSVLSGSFARQVIREAPCPVWVLRVPEI